MPPSRSPSRAPKRPEPIRLLRPMIILGVLAVIGFVLFALPASLVTRFLPAQIHAEDFSGTLWHGSAGKLSAFGHDAGACEWRIHPLSLLGFSLNADLHWVKSAAVIDGSVQIDRHSYRAQHIHGSTPIEELHDLGIAPAWRGLATFELSDLRGAIGQLTSIAGTANVSGLSSAGVAAGEDLGNYQVLLAPDASSSDGAISATITDQGGPLELRAQAQYAPASHTGLLTGTLKERPEASATLREQLQNLTQMRARDSAGRIPVDLEFTL